MAIEERERMTETSLGRHMALEEAFPSIEISECQQVPVGRISGIPEKFVEVPVTDEAGAAVSGLMRRYQNLRPVLRTFSPATYKHAKSWVEVVQKDIGYAIPDDHGHGGRIDPCIRYHTDEENADHDQRIVDRLNTKLDLEDIEMAVAFEHPVIPRSLSRAAFARLHSFALSEDPARPHTIVPILEGVTGKLALPPNPYRVMWPYVPVNGNVR